MPLRLIYVNYLCSDWLLCIVRCSAETLLIASTFFWLKKLRIILFSIIWTLRDLLFSNFNLTFPLTYYFLSCLSLCRDGLWGQDEYVLWYSWVFGSGGFDWFFLHSSCGLVGARGAHIWDAGRRGEFTCLCLCVCGCHNRMWEIFKKILISYL